MTSKIGFSAEYVETLSPSERQMYINYFIEEKKEEEKARKKSNNSVPIGGPPVGE